MVPFLASLGPSYSLAKSQILTSPDLLSLNAVVSRLSHLSLDEDFDIGDEESTGLAAIT